MAGLEIIIQDYSGLYQVRDQVRRATYGVVHAVLLCFDISSPESFENVEHKVRIIITATLCIKLTEFSGITKPTCT